MATTVSATELPAIRWDDTQGWLEALRRQREDGVWLLLDGEGSELIAVVGDAEGRLQEMRLYLSGHGESAVPRPSALGMGEAIAAEERLASRLARLRWEPPTHLAKKVRGKGVFTYPLGPVRGDVAESLAYRLRVMGDEIVRVDIQEGWKRRGVAGRALGLPAAAATAVVERTTGTSTVAHALAYSQAVEAALGLVPEEGALALRSLWAEWERLHSHLWDLAALAAATGLPVAQMEYLHGREIVLRWAGRLFGHRYLRGLVRPGGILWKGQAEGRLWQQARGELERLSQALRSVRRDLLQTTSFLDRLVGTGSIPPATVDLVRPVGPVGRAAGRPLDVRRWRPYAAYAALSPRIAAASSGDAYARLLVRLDELETSLGLVIHGLERAAAGPPPPAPVLPPAAAGRGVGVVEAPRGLLAYRVVLDQGILRHLAVATPSARNWYTVSPALANHNILQDFPIIDASFNLSVAGWDG